jgi:hypothetical protein
MKVPLRDLFYPVPEPEKLDTGLLYTDILFGLVIGELFVRLQKWTQLNGAVRWHLIVGTTLVLGSWIGFRRSRYRSGYQLKFFNLPLLRFLIDQLMLILYFRVAVLTEVGGKESPGAADLARSTAKLVMFVFILYAFWDVLGMCIAKAKTKGGDGTKKPLYPVVKDSVMTNEEQKINWVGFYITAGSLGLFVVVWFLADRFKPNLLFLATTAILLVYRWAKEIRTSCQLPRPV